jgi:hypothetical protein
MKMLDEKLEYEQYTFDVSSYNKETVTRLKYNTLIHNSLAGLRRPMTIVARHFMFGDLQENIKISNMYEREIADRMIIHVLKVWCGFEKPDSGDSDEIRRLDGWLPAYIRRCMTASKYKIEPSRHKIPISTSDKNDLIVYINNLACSETDEEYFDLYQKLTDLDLVKPGSRLLANIMDALIKLKEKNELWSKPQIDPGDDGIPDQKGKMRNTMNLITYEKIIGNAIRHGTLETYYLACRHNRISECYTSKNNNPPALLSAELKDFILKGTAACMLELSHYGTTCVTDSKFIVVNSSDWSNWSMGQKCQEERKNLFYKNKQLFTTPDIRGQNYLQLMLSQEWLDDCKWRILKGNDEAKEFHRQHPKWTIFKDQGAGKPLTEFNDILDL